jgi:hypothetical protein
MKEYDITLRIAFDTLTLKDVSKAIKRKPLSGSYNKGDMRGGKISDKTWFFVMSWKSLSDISTKQADRVLIRLANAMKTKKGGGNYITVLDIAVFSDQEATSFFIPNYVVIWVAEHMMEIRITTYICDMKR